MVITLTTDFGYQDPYAGIMKGVIAGIDPQARVIDVSHGVPPQDVMAGALTLRHSVPYFPRGTIHLAVVDPGVGSARRPLLIESDGSYFVGPDNGVLSLALEERQPQRIIHLSNGIYHLQPTSATFHGRDIFAPVAAYLSLGVAPAAFGETVEGFVRLASHKVVKSERSIAGEIVYIDRFGNLSTNIREQDLESLRKGEISITLGKLTIQGLASNYAAGVKGGWIAVINSWGLLEIALYRDNAQRHCQGKVGDKVYLSVT